MNLEIWKKKQLDKYIKNQKIEYIFEEKEYFIIVFDKNMGILNYRILKNMIYNKQTLITKLFDISNSKELHNKLNKKIYKELHSKLDKYLF